MPGPGRGRPPKPTAIKVIQGTFRPSREIENPAPELYTKAPKPPKNLTRKDHPIARKEWARIAPELVELGLLSNVDLVALECYCLAYERKHLAEEALGDGLGMTFTTPNGYQQQRPELSIAAQASKEVLGYLVQFGMSPASRSRVSSPKKKTGAADPMEDLLNGTR